MEVRISDLIGGAFGESRRAVRAGAKEVVEAGGRGSGKSSYLSVELVLQLLRHPGCHALVLRKVANTLRTSVFAQVQWAVEQLGLGSRFRCLLSPLELEYLPTGQKILFFGMDDAGKLKSLKLSRGHVGILWFEELDQFTAEEVRSAEQSVLRGGEFSLTLKSFNPPPDPDHWVNRLEEKPGRFFHRSTYLDLPAQWLGPRFLEDADHLRRVNRVAYEHEYLGLPVGAGERVFANLVLGPFGAPGGLRTVCGVDWGWWPDPWAFDRVAYDSRNRALYILREGHGHRLSNRESGEIALALAGPDEPVLADGAEPKSIADYRSLGMNCRAAYKGPGSLRYGMKWLQSLKAIYIDPAVCPHTAREFRSCTYDRGDFPDRNNHHIDAVRYAAGAFWRREEG